VLLLGESGVGKSSLLTRFVSDSFDEHHSATVGVDFSVKLLSLPQGRCVKLTVWDTAGACWQSLLLLLRVMWLCHPALRGRHYIIAAGQEKFRALTSTFYRGAQGVVLV
jgi:Ras-related protein Rab-18